MPAVLACDAIKASVGSPGGGAGQLWVLPAPTIVSAGRRGARSPYLSLRLRIVPLGRWLPPGQASRRAVLASKSAKSRPWKRSDFSTSLYLRSIQADFTLIDNSSLGARRALRSKGPMPHAEPIMLQSNAA